MAHPTTCRSMILNLRLLPRLPIELRAKLGVPLAELLFEMSAPRRVLVIDSAEYAVESGSELLRQLLESARKAEVSAWVLSTTDGLAAVRSTVEATFESFSEHEVGVLDDAEIEEIGKGLPQLGVLLTDPRARELLRRPVVGDLLARAEPADQLLSESDVLGVIWEGIVRRSVGRAQAMPGARDQVMRRLAQQQLYDLKASEVFDELDPGALQGLRRDGLVRDPPDAPWAVLPEFSHEMVRTFALAQVLLVDGEPVDELLAAGSPRWALPAARTAAQAQLAAADSSTFPIGGRLRRVQTSFDRLVTAGHGERWSDLPIEAALALPNAGLLRRS